MTLPFNMSDQHQRILLESLDMLDASLIFAEDIADFSQRHCNQLMFLVLFYGKVADIPPPPKKKEAC